MELAVRRAAPAVRADAGSARAPAGPQRDALGTAFGLSAGRAPDRFLVGLAVLSLLADVAEERPLVCLVDDAQWLDQASAQALAFVARRLLAESVALVFAARDAAATSSAGCRSSWSRVCAMHDARALLDAVIRAPLDERVRDRIVAETRGNPLALLELPRGLTPAELAGGFGLPDALPLSGRIEESFRRRLEPLPAETRRLLLLAAAEPVGDPVLLWRAAERLGIGVEAAAPAEAGRPARVRRPGAVPPSAGALGGLPGGVAPGAPARAHRALAEATDPERRSRPPRLAPRAGGARARRGRRRASSSARPAGRRRAAASPRRPRSSSGPPS